MAIDWTKPIETLTGEPLRLLTLLECAGDFGGTNPDQDGDYWVTKENPLENRIDEWCVDSDGDYDGRPSRNVRNRATPA